MTTGLSKFFESLLGKPAAKKSTAAKKKTAGKKATKKVVKKTASKKK